MDKKTSKSSPVNQKSKDQFLIFLLLVTIFVFIKGMSSDLLNFDDNEYFENYPEVQNFSFANIKKYFSSYYVLMYQPLPILSFALTYKFFKLDPTAHHIINLAFHLFNIYLVYLFIGKISKRPIIVKTVTFLFALHPLAVEAVMWFSCRSSGMYVCFYLLGLLSYINFKNSENKKYLFACIFWFILSLLSKAHAVTFPLTLIVLDIFIYQIKLSKTLILNKIPFFVLSIIFGIVTLLNKDTANNISFGVQNYAPLDYFFLLTYELIWYLVKVIIPVGLGPIYVYPPKIYGLLPYYYYLAPLMLASIIYFTYKKIKSHPYILFGFILFLTALSVSLQILPSRQVIVADRYAYFPNIGLFFIMASFYNDWLEGKIIKFKLIKPNKTIGFIIGGLIIMLTFFQIDIWKNNMTLAQRIIEVNPETDYIGRAYGIMANYKKDNLNDVEAALGDYKKALELDSTDWIAYYQIGLIYKSMNDYSNAILNMEKAHKNNLLTPIPLVDIGVMHIDLKNYQLALLFSDSALKVNNKFPKALNLKAVSLLNMGKPVDAEIYLTKAIGADPNFGEAIKNRGIVRYQNLNNKTGACEDFKKAADLGEPGMNQIIEQYCK